MADLLHAMFLGLVVGSIYALMAFGLVLTYRTSGVLNFAHGAVGMFFAYAYFQLTQGGRLQLVVTTYEQRWRAPAPIALILVAGFLAPAFGWGLHRVLFRGLRDAPSVVKIVATIGVLVSLIGLAGVVWGAGTSLAPKSIFSEHVLAVGEFRTSIKELATVALAVAGAAGLMAFLRYSPLGVRMRAVVDRAELAELVGVDSERVAGTSWAIGTALGALAGILLAPFFGTLDPLTLSILVITASAAAVVGRLESLPLTLAGAFAIGIIQFVVQAEAPTEVSRQLQPSIPFIVLLAVLMLPIGFREVAEPLKGRMAGARRAGPWRGPRTVLVLAGLSILPFLVGSSWQVHLATVPPVALLFLSLVLLSGHAGQISLSQAAFAGFGAFVAAHLVADHGVPFLLAAPAGALAAVPLGVLLAARAARLPPLFLGFATLAFGAVMDQVAFTSQKLAGGLVGIPFERPSWLAGPRAYYLATLGVFAAVALVVHNLRRGRTGLALAAMRDSPVGVASLGTSVMRLKFVVFCVSAFIAGLAGALLAGASGRATPFNFFEFQSLLVLALAAVGGIGRWTGAVVGAMLFELAGPFVSQPSITDNVLSRHLFHGQLPALLPVFFGLGAIGLAQNPNGIVEQVREGYARLREGYARLREGLPARLSARRPAQAGSDSSPSATGGPAVRLVRFPGGTLYHRSVCPLAAGKDAEAILVDGGTDGSLVSCPVCDPGPVPGPPAPATGEPETTVTP